MYGLGKALLAGSQAFTDARDQQLAREKTRQQMERAALEMALMKDEEQRAKEKFTLDSDNANLKLAHDLASSFEDQSLVPEEVGARFKGTPGEMFFKPDQTLDSKALTGIGQLIGGNTPMQAPTETASPGQLTGKGFRSQLPIDSKAALQTSKLQSDLAKAQAGYYQRALDRDSRENVADANRLNAKDIAMLRIATQQGNRENLSISDRLGLENRHAQEWVKATTDFNKKKNALNEMKTALASIQGGDAQRWGAPGQVIITQFNRLIDPASVVRESEYARTPEGAPILDRFMGLFNKLSHGGVGVQPAELQEYVQLADKLINSGTAGISAAKARIDRNVERFGLDPRAIYGDVPDANFGQQPAGLTTPAGGGGLVVGPDGKVRRQ